MKDIILISAFINIILYGVAVLMVVGGFNPVASWLFVSALWLMFNGIVWEFKDA